MGAVGIMLIQGFLVDTTLLFDFPEFERGKIVDCVALISLAATWITVQGFCNTGKDCREL